MAFDLHTNLASATVAIAPSPDVSGNTLTVEAGRGLHYSPPPFNATVCPKNQTPDQTNSEVVRVTARDVDTFTFTRISEGGTARAIKAGDLFTEVPTAKTFQDIESGLNFPEIDTPGDVASGGTVSGPVGEFQSLGSTPLDAASLTGTVVDARLSVNVLTHTGGYPGGTTAFLRSDGTFAAVSGGVAPHAASHYVGGTDPITGDLSLNKVTINGGVLSFATAAEHIIGVSGADTSSLTLCGGVPVTGGGARAAHGAQITLNGNAEQYNPGGINIQTGDVLGAYIRFQTNPDTARGQIHSTGGFSWGNLVDPGAGNFSVTGSISTASGSVSAGTFLNAGNGTIYFGSASAAFPAFVRSGTTVQVMTGDQAAWAPVTAGSFYSVLGGTNFADLIVRGATNFQGGVTITGGVLSTGRILTPAGANLHLDAAIGMATYINYFAGNAVYFCNGANGATASMTAAGALTVVTLTVNGSATMTGTLQTGNPIYPGAVTAANTIQGSWYLAGHSSYGLYTNTGFYIEGQIWSASNINAAGRLSGGEHVILSNISSGFFGSSHIAVGSLAATGEMYFHSNGVLQQRLDSNGDLGPAADNTRRIGIPSHRYTLIRGVTITPGDLLFENDWALTEAYKVGIDQPGLALMDSVGELIAFFGKDTLYIKPVADVSTLAYAITTAEERSQMDLHPELRVKGWLPNKGMKRQPIYKTRGEVPDRPTGERLTDKQRQCSA